MTSSARAHTSGKPSSVGLIGLGQMGAAMCRTLLALHWRVAVWDISPIAVRTAATAGAEPAESPADIASRAQIIITSLPDAVAVRSVALGDQGVVQGGRDRLILLDTSTIGPEEARSLAADLAPYGADFLDAPVSGGVGGAETGTLAVMVGGSAELVERAWTVLSSIGKVVVHCGPVGSGQIAKACNQLVVMATHESLAEALVLAETAGLDPWRVWEALVGGYTSSPIMRDQGQRMLKRDFTPGGKSIYHVKDITTISRLAIEAGVDLPAFRAAARQIERLIDAGGGDLDNSAVITVIDVPTPRVG